MTVMKNRRIAFLDSPYLFSYPYYRHFPPLSLLYLAAMMEKEGYTVNVLSADTTCLFRGLYYIGSDEARVLAALHEFRPDIVGITSPAYPRCWAFTRRLTQLIRRHFPESVIVLGGLFPSTEPGFCLDDSEADYLILGEGENTFVQLCNALESGERPDSVQALAFRQDDDVIVTPRLDYISDLDSLPFPAYHLLEMERHRELCRRDRSAILRGLFFSLLTSRSCPHSCSFCNQDVAHGKKWRARSAENVLAEIEMAVSQYGVRQFSIEDNIFTLNRSRLLKILKGIVARFPDLKFIMPNGVSVRTLDNEVCYHLRQAGFTELPLAIESGSEFIRNEVYSKQLDDQQIVAAVEACRKHDILPRCFIMVGAPQETDATIQETIDLLRRIRTPAQVSVTTPYPGTPLYQQYVEAGYIDETRPVEERFLDLALPASNLPNRDQICRWRRKVNFYHMLYCWRELLPHRIRFLNPYNVFKYLLFLVNSKPVTDEDVAAAVERFLPLPADHK